MQWQLGAIAPIRTANSALLQGVLGTCSSGKFFQIEVLWDAIKNILNANAWIPYWTCNAKIFKKKHSQTKGGGGGRGQAGHSWPTPKSTLDPRVLNPPYPRTTFLHKKTTIITPLGVVVHLDKGQVGENPGNEVEGALVTNCSILKDFHI